MFNKEKLLIKMNEKNISFETLAGKAKIPLSALNLKINRKSAFYDCDVEKICTALNIFDTRIKSEIFFDTTS